MSRRPIAEKKKRKLVKLLTRQELPAYIDLVQYLVDRRLVDTKRAAREAIMSDRVKANSHTLSEAFVSADLRGAITVKADG